MKNKIFILNLLLIIFIFFITTNVKATSVTTPLGKELPATIPDDGFTDYVIYERSKAVELITFNNTETYPVVTVNDSGSVDLLNVLSPKYFRGNGDYVSSGKILANIYILSDGSWVASSPVEHVYDDSSYGAADVNVSSSNDLIYSSCDLKGSYKNYGTYEFVDEILFQKAPVPYIPLNLREVQELKAGATMAARLILPACLAIFGILLLVYLIRSKKLLHLS